MAAEKAAQKGHCWAALKAATSAESSAALSAARTDYLSVDKKAGCLVDPTGRDSEKMWAVPKAARMAAPWASQKVASWDGCSVAPTAAS